MVPAEASAFLLALAELSHPSLSKVSSHVLFAADAARLREAGVDVGTVVLDGGHEWTPAFSAEAGAFLKRQTQ